MVHTGYAIRTTQLGHSPLMAVVIALAAMLPQTVFSQGATVYPSKTVRVIVPSAPGGSVDIVPRLVAAKLSENLKHQFIIENRAGGGGAIGSGFVAKSAPDGYTLLATGATFTIAPALYPDLPYDSVRDFMPISLVSKSPFLLLTHPAVPAKTVKELIALAKAKPGALDMGVGFSGSFTHLVAASFASAANIKVTFIPFKGSGDVVINAMSGQVNACFVNVLAALPHVKSGRLRALAVTSAERSLVAPQVPTVSEAGVRGYEVSAWTGWIAPAAVPAAIAGKLSAEIAKAVRSPDVADKLAADGGEAAGSTPEQFQKLITDEVPRWVKVVKETGMRVN